MWLFNIINVFQSVFSYAFLQEDSARRTRRGFHEFHFGAAGKAHDIHVGPLQLVDVPENFHDVLFGVNARSGVSGTAASGAVIVGGGSDDLAPFDKNGAMNTGVMFFFEHDGPGIFSEEFQNVSLGSFKDFHFVVKMVGRIIVSNLLSGANKRSE